MVIFVSFFCHHENAITLASIAQTGSIRHAVFLHKKRTTL